MALLLSSVLVAGILPGIPGDMKQVPKSKLASYETLLKARGVGKKAKIKK